LRFLTLQQISALLNPGMNLCVAALLPRTNSYRQSATPKFHLSEVPGASHLCEWRGLRRTNGEKALILRAQSARKMSALNEKMHKWDTPEVPGKLENRFDDRFNWQPENAVGKWQF
jgi:hypothetical protein